jgi:hypothetical protein
MTRLNPDARAAGQVELDAERRDVTLSTTMVNYGGRSLVRHESPPIQGVALPSCFEVWHGSCVPGLMHAGDWMALLSLLGGVQVTIQFAGERNTSHPSSAKQVQRRRQITTKARSGTVCVRQSPSRASGRTPAVVA